MSVHSKWHSSLGLKALSVRVDEERVADDRGEAEVVVAAAVVREGLVDEEVLLSVDDGEFVLLFYKSLLFIHHSASRLFSVLSSLRRASSCVVHRRGRRSHVKCNVVAKPTTITHRQLLSKG